MSIALAVGRIRQENFTPAMIQESIIIINQLTETDRSELIAALFNRAREELAKHDKVAPELLQASIDIVRQLTGKDKKELITALFNRVKEDLSKAFNQEAVEAASVLLRSLILPNSECDLINVLLFRQATKEITCCSTKASEVRNELDELVRVKQGLHQKYNPSLRGIEYNKKWLEEELQKQQNELHELRKQQEVAKQLLEQTEERVEALKNQAKAVNEIRKKFLDAMHYWKSTKEAAWAISDLHFISHFKLRQIQLAYVLFEKYLLDNIESKKAYIESLDNCLDESDFRKTDECAQVVARGNIEDLWVSFFLAPEIRLYFYLPGEKKEIPYVGSLPRHYYDLVEHNKARRV